jgi:exodeoxyribonuclease V alpha subunit
MKAARENNAGDRPIDHAFARWIRRQTGSELLARAAFAVSRAEGQGHACAALDEDAAFAADEIAALRAQSWVGDGNSNTPFVLDAAARLYTLRNFQHEALLASGLIERARARSNVPPQYALAADVAELFGDEDSEATRGQRAAVAAAPGSRLFVLTGGPGTGKTATALRLLLVLLRRAEACGLPLQPAIALAAPTGKAAQRLAHALLHGKQHLQHRLAAQSEFQPLLARIPHAEACTLHRLLGYRPRENTFARGARDPIAADIVLVDEASMVDLALMRTLVRALRPGAMLILLGDPGQLAAVEAGSVLSDIVTSAAENAQATPRAARSPLNGRVLTLRHVWRAGSGLQQGLEALRAGDAGWLEGFLAERHHGDMHLHACADAAALHARVVTWLDVRAEVYAGILSADTAPQAALAQLRKMQALCALRDGAFGTRGISAVFERELGARHGFDPSRTWYHGRPVLIQRNDYARGLYNGDIGIAIEGAEGLRVWFEVGHRDGSIGVRSFSPRALPEHETAWAITIHRSQGSEYGDVAVVLPPDPEHRILSRELVYTAVSRATRSAEIWTTPESLRAAASRPIRRVGGLRDRLR